MPDAMENRAAVFTSAPQDVEVLRSGGWRPGSMLGWRHERDGSCRAWVRLAAAGRADETTWIDLADVRLPEPQALRSIDDTLVPALRSTSRGTPSRQTADVAAPSEMTATMNLFAIRDLADAPGGGRAPSLRAGGRRRAPETDGNAAAGGYWAALDPAGARAAEPAAAPGRHRAPAGGTGRHRAADTGSMPAVTAAEGPAGEPTRPAVPPAQPAFSAAVHDAPDAELYTRPLRLATSVAQQRGGGWDGLPGGF